MTLGKNSKMFAQETFVAVPILICSKEVHETAS